LARKSLPRGIFTSPGFEEDSVPVDQPTLDPDPDPDPDLDSEGILDGDKLVEGSGDDIGLAIERGRKVFERGVEDGPSAACRDGDGDFDVLKALVYAL